jgi:hypothetical protein
MLRAIRTLLFYPSSLLEMYRARRSPLYINRFAAHTNALHAYLLTRGYSEWIEALVFGPRRWRLPPHSPPNANHPTMATHLSIFGYAYLDAIIPVDNVIRDLSQTTFVGRLTGERLNLVELENRHKDLRGRYDACQAALLALESFANLVTSDYIYSLTKAIMGPRFMVTSSLAWASFPCDAAVESIASAQVFHMDYDYLDDLKLFVNLSDVYPSSGPLEYVAGSHRPGSKKIWSSEPIDEKSVWGAHPRMNRILFTGAKGSAYISDNRGLHRDAPPDSGSWKLALQVNFSRSQFGSEQIYAKSRPPLSPMWPSYKIWANAISSRPFVYDLLFSSSCVA